MVDGCWVEKKMKMQCHTDKVFERRREADLVNSAEGAVGSEAKAKVC